MALSCAEQTHHARRHRVVLAIPIQDLMPGVAARRVVERKVCPPDGLPDAAQGFHDARRSATPDARRPTHVGRCAVAASSSGRNRRGSWASRAAAERDHDLRAASICCLPDGTTLQTPPSRCRSITAQTPDTYSAPSHFNVWPIGHDKTTYPDYRREPAFVAGNAPEASKPCTCMCHPAARSGRLGLRGRAGLRSGGL
jgi:hypothetical protein